MTTKVVNKVSNVNNRKCIEYKKESSEMIVKTLMQQTFKKNYTSAWITMMRNKHGLFYGPFFFSDDVNSVRSME